MLDRVKPAVNVPDKNSIPSIGVLKTLNIRRLQIQLKLSTVPDYIVIAIKNARNCPTIIELKRTAKSKFDQ